MGNAQARSQLGALYATGHCVPLDRARAYNWFSLAVRAASGHNIWIERNRQMLWEQMTEAEKARALGAQ
jgi:TPR repeat protein